MNRSPRTRGVIATVLASGLALSACSGGTTAGGTTAETTVGTTAGTAGDSTAPDDGGSVESALLQGEFTTLSGETIDLGSLQGQDVVFWFWAPW